MRVGSLLAACALAEEMRYPDGVRPGDQLGGTGAEFFRYRSAFIRPPTEEDRFRSVTIANKIKCEVCEAVLWYLVPLIKTFDDEGVQDILDGDFQDPNLPLEDKGDKQSGVLKKALVGCNRFFKYVLREGYRVKKCTDEALAAEQEHCFELTDNIPSMNDLETYSMDKEAVFTACEGTIKAKEDDIKEALIEYHSEGAAPEDYIPKICQKKAKCAAKKKKKKAEL
jgi:hypothetical protein